jgi:A/G-specific adenine glycosylase
MTHEQSNVLVDPRRAARFRRRLLAWYSVSGRHDLPWRQTDDPWHILLAELMLQRTRADLVVPVYERVTMLLPRAADVAEAPADQLHELFRPLGLLHRVERIQRAAEAVKDGVPRSLSGLLDIPGVGQYAASATACFAFNHRLAIVDPSIIRILDRIFAIRSDRTRPRVDPRLWHAAAKLMPRTDPRCWNYAMLDFGSAVCAARPKCATCPILPLCPTGRRLQAGVDYSDSTTGSSSRSGSRTVKVTSRPSAGLVEAGATATNAVTTSDGVSSSGTASAGSISTTG